MSFAKGLLGIVGIWLTMAMMPLSELLNLSALQSTWLRGMSGFIVIGLCGLFRPTLIAKPDISTIKVVVSFVLATVCLFNAIAAWGANYSALFLDLAILVPLSLLWLKGGRVGLVTLAAIVVAIFGTALTLRVFDGVYFESAGLLWSIGALVANGFVIHFAGETKQENWNKAFWMSVGLVAVGLPSLLIEPLAFGSSSLSIVTWILLVVLFAVTTGMLNFYFSFVAFEHLGSVAVGVLVLGVTPSIMFASYFLLDRSLGWDQVIGVAITLAAVLAFGNTLRQTEVNT